MLSKTVFLNIYFGEQTYSRKQLLDKMQNSYYFILPKFTLEFDGLVQHAKNGKKNHLHAFQNKRMISKMFVFSLIFTLI